MYSLSMIEIFNLYMNNYYDKNKLFVISFIFITVLFIILESVVVPLILGKIITNIDKPTLYLNLIIGTYIIIFLLYFIKKKYEIKILPDLLTYPRNIFFSSLIDKYSENYKSLKMGSNISRINLITWVFRECSLFFTECILPHILIIIFLSIIFLYFNFNLGLITILSIIVFLLVILFLKYDFHKRINYVDEFYYKLDNDLVDIFSSLMNTYLNNNEVKEKERINNSQNMYNLGLRDVHIADSKLCYLLYFVTIITSILSIFYIVLSNNENKIILLILLIYFINSLLTLSKNYPIFLYKYYITVDSNSYVKNILNIHTNNLQQEINNGNIELKNLNFGYKKNQIILKNVNLVIKDKEKIAIVGRSGSGKSTLSKLLLKFYKYNGIITLNNIDIKRINTKYLRSKIIYANQKTILYDIPIIDNIKYGNNSESEYVLKILTDYDLLDVFSGLKTGIYSDSGVQGNELSGGMQKIVILLRTILKAEESKAFVIIFDEPLAGLDSKTREKVIKLIKDKCSNKTLIIITHDKEILPFMDRIIDLSEVNNTINKSRKIRNLKKNKLYS